MKITAVDKQKHTQDTEPVTIKVVGGGGVQNVDSNKEWFPLQIDLLSGTNSGVLSSLHPESIKEVYSINTFIPTIKGIAFSQAQVHLTVIDKITNEERAYSTTATGSSWVLTPTLFSDSYLHFSVESVQGKYIELPVFELKVE